MQVMVGCHGRPLIAAIMVKSLRFGLRIWESAITSSAPTNYAIKKTGSDCHEGIVREKKVLLRHLGVKQGRSSTHADEITFHATRRTINHTTR